MSEKDYESMGMDEINDLNLEELGAEDPAEVALGEESPKAAAPDTPAEEPPAEEEVAAEEVPAEEAPGEIEAKVEIETEPELDKNGNAITRDPLKDTQAELSRKSAQLAERERELAEAKRALEEKDIEAVEELSEEELDELADTDPRAYRDYVDRKVRADHQKERLESDRKDNAIKSMNANLGTVIKDLWNVDVDLNKSYDNNGVYSTGQLRDAQKALFFDEMVAIDRTKTRDTVVGDMQRASKQTSVLDTKPGESSRPKGIDDYTQAEIEKMKQDENPWIRHVLKEVDWLESKT